MESALVPLLLLMSMAAALGLAHVMSSSSYFNFLHQRKNRFGTIDGLRGYLAFGVFLLHFVITWHWKDTGVWEKPPEEYIWNIGRVAVYVFFMITGFLFISKLINSKDGSTKGTNWLQLYQSRVFRIYPLYVATVIVGSALVFAQTGWTLQSSLSEIVVQHVKWLAFIDNPINQYKDTIYVFAGVIWTLKYEWLFYLSLPFVALAFRLGPIGTVLLGLAIIYLFFIPTKVWYFETQFLIFFLVGGIAAFIAKKGVSTELMASKLVSVVALLCLLGSLLYQNHMDIFHVLMMSVFFLCVCLGNDLFGLLSTRASILLGEISYSMYLIHGVILFILFTQMSVADISSMSRTAYLAWLIVPTGIVVVLVSAATFLLIEKPGMQLGRSLNFSRKRRS